MRKSTTLVLGVTIIDNILSSKQEVTKISSRCDRRLRRGNERNTITLFNFIFALNIGSNMNPEEADEFLDSLEVGLKQGFK